MKSLIAQPISLNSKYGYSGFHRVFSFPLTIDTIASAIVPDEEKDSAGKIEES